MKKKIVTGITIDDVISRDLDDAFWITEGPEHYFLKVFISDVASTILADSERKLYDMAYTRVETQYYSKGNDPMLPRSYSEDKLSLIPGQERKVICYDITVSKSTWEVEDFSFHKCFFKSIRRLSYGDVHAYLMGERTGIAISKEIGQVLHLAFALSSRLLQKRRDMGALMVYDVFKDIILDEEGKPIKVSKEKHRGYILIQELMILTNAAAANFAVQHKIPFIFRTHRMTMSGHQEDLMREYNNLILSPDPNTLDMVQRRLDHMLEPAEYSVKHGEHWALRLPWYTHVTSPIRRLADLINQINILSYIDGMDYQYPWEDIKTAAGHINAVLKEHERQRYERQSEKELALFPTEDWLSSLKADDFSRQLKLVAKSEGAIHELFLTELEKRVSDDRLEVRDFVLILFNEKFRELKTIRTKSIELLCANTVRIKPLINHLCQSYGAVVPEISYESSNGLFNATTSFVFNEKTYEHNTGRGRTKKDAMEHAYANLLRAMFDMEPLVQLVKEEKPAATKEQKVSVFELVEVKGDNYIAALLESTQKAKIKSPEFTFNELGNSLVPKFECTATMIPDGNEITGTATASTKKGSKALAAESLYRKLSGAK